MSYQKFKKWFIDYRPIIIAVCIVLFAYILASNFDTGDSQILEWMKTPIKELTVTDILVLIMIQSFFK